MCPFRFMESGYFTPDSRLFRIYISLSALLGPPNGIGFIAVDAAGFFAWGFAAKAADVDRLRIARLTISALFMLELLWNGNGSAVPTWPR